MVEMVFLLYRSLLPVPAWLKYYSKDSDYFAAIYFVLKVTVFAHCLSYLQGRV